jgi:VWFA-related protein
MACAEDDTSTTFQAKTDLVLVPVVVRDQQGHAVGNLRREDFQVFDRRKPQVVASFSIESTAKPEGANPAPAAEREPPITPDHLVVYLFDDVHLSSSDLAAVRDAAERHLKGSLGPADRAAIFTTSGRTLLDFTNDPAKLHETLLKLRPQPIARPMSKECPDVSYYQADLIVNKHDPGALQTAVQDAFICMNLPDIHLAPPIAQAAARRALSAGDTESRVALGMVGKVVRALSTVPGQRSIVLISPGFLTLADLQQDSTAIMDLAIRSNIIINSLDARGLYTVVPGGDAGQAVQNIAQTQDQGASAAAGEDVLAALADATGGAFFHDNNDLAEGFRRVAARPEYVYVLGFSPRDLKPDGKFHDLRVTLKDPGKLTLRARRGYYAPKPGK